ncbi:MAG: hypothetical protein KKE23_04485 [Nanoarchaeota archaeon]|nr:hypothetical protein [Nanoarchaeota archaeon]
MSDFNIFSNPRKSRYDPDLARRVNEEKEPVIIRKEKPEAKIQNPQKAGLKGFIYVPSINLYLSKETSYKGKSWNECHEIMSKEDCFMPTIKHFVEFVKYLKTDYQDRKEAETILDEILAVRNPWRAEWLDGKFEKRNKGLYLLSDHRFEKGKLKANYEQPLKDCLMEDKTPGIDLESYLKNANSQGLPSQKTKDGKLYYWFPRAGSVAGFDVYSGRADLYCDYVPGGRYVGLGVRRVTAEGGSQKTK